MKPNLNKGDIQIDSIVEMFEFLCPDDWWELQLKHTNPMLLGTLKIDAISRRAS